MSGNELHFPHCNELCRDGEHYLASNRWPVGGAEPLIGGLNAGALIGGTQMLFGGRIAWHLDVDESHRTDFAEMDSVDIVCALFPDHLSQALWLDIGRAVMTHRPRLVTIGTEGGPCPNCVNVANLDLRSTGYTVHHEGPVILGWSQDRLRPSPADFVLRTTP